MAANNITADGGAIHMRCCFSSVYFFFAGFGRGRERAVKKKSIIRGVFVQAKKPENVRESLRLKINTTTILDIPGHVVTGLVYSTGRNLIDEFIYIVNPFVHGQENVFLKKWNHTIESCLASSLFFPTSG